MGMTHVTVTVRNLADNEKAWEGLFLVDTGAVDCLVPAQHLHDIGIEPKAKRTYELADGSEIKMDVAGAQIEFMGDVVWTTVIFGPNDAEPILGVTALESVGIEVDPRSERLKRLPAARLKRSATKTSVNDDVRAALLVPKGVGWPLAALAGSSSVRRRGPGPSSFGRTDFHHGLLGVPLGLVLARCEGNSWGRAGRRKLTRHQRVV